LLYFWRIINDSVVLAEKKIFFCVAIFAEDIQGKIDTFGLFGPLLTKRFDKLYGKSLYYKHLKI